jgi:hypothetical protein
MPYTRLLLLCTLLVLPVEARSESRVATGTSAYHKLRLTRAEAHSLKDANATQFLAANTKGQLFLLRGDTLEVFRLGSDGGFDRRVGKLACKPFSGSAYAAAMDPTGSSWAVSSAHEVELCDFEKERRPEGLQWVISSRSGPLIAVTDLGPAPGAAEARYKRTEPRVFGLKDDRWEAVAWGPISESKEMPENPLTLMAEGKAESDALICTGRKESIWRASWNAYRLQKLSSSEKPEREIIVGKGEVEWQKLDKKEQAREAGDRKVQGLQLVAFGAGSSAPVPRGVVRALLCAPDGALYLIVSTDDGLALDRFDPSQNLLERVLLDGAEVSASGPMSATFSGDELWLGGRLARDGLWRISPEDLAAARWKPVKGVIIDGKPMP